MNAPSTADRASVAAAGERHLNALTGVRAFAAMWVLLFHCWLNAGSPPLRVGTFAHSLDLSPLVAYGWLGLDVFFVLSGFLLCRQASLRLDRRVGPGSGGRFRRAFGERYGGFLRRRVLRVFPAYYACLTALLLLAAAGLYLRLPDYTELLLHLGMVHNFIEKYIATMNGVFWTLPFEWQFYLAFPLLFVLLRRHGGWALYGFALCCVVVSKLAVMVTNNGYPQLLLPIRIDEFAAGMCAGAYALHHRGTRAQATAAFWIGIAILLATPWAFKDYPGVGHYYDLKGFVRPAWIQAGICLMLIGLTGAPHVGARIFDNRIAGAIGLISYSIYLFHIPVIELLPKLGLLPSRGLNGASFARVVATAAPAVILVAALSYRFVERPFQSSGKAGIAADGASSQRTPLLRHPLWTLAGWALALLLLLVVAR